MPSQPRPGPQPPLATKNTLHLHPCTAADIPHLTTLYLTSFTDALSHACFPRSLPATAPWWTDMNVEDFASQPSARFLKVVDVAGREGVGADVAAAGDGASLADAEVGGSGGEGKLVAYGKWNVPTLYARTGQLVSGGDDPDAINEEMWPEGGDRGLATDFFGELARRRSRIMSLGDGKAQGMRPHAYLEIVCTLPEWQGHGAASLILAWGTHLADAQGLECYCEAGPGLVPLYARFGFEVVEEFRPTSMVGHVESLMVRRARARGG